MGDRISTRPERLILTDLDGTLIDHHTYSAEPARPALDASATAGVPVVLCSSKTRAEMHALASRLGLAPAPLIAENGSVVWWPPRWPAAAGAHASGDGDGSIAVLGAPAAHLLRVLPRLGGVISRRLLPLSLMSTDEVVARTGLTADVARLAAAREYSQPFVVEGDEVPLAVLQAAARQLGVRVTQGGRFFHLIGQTDKGAAARVVRDTCAPANRALGLGDAPNDLPLLQAVDVAVIVPQPDRGCHPELLGALPGARHAPCPGPAGWNAAVLEWLG